jgi:4-hydroxy-3-polyprenylbenzoate decarboxylase
MPPQSLREFIEILKKHNELKTISAKVDAELEITEIASRTTNQGGPALLFTNVAGSSVPLFINAFSAERRVGLALGVDSLDEVKNEIASLVRTEFPRNWREKLKTLPKLKRLATVQPKLVKHAPCQQVIIKDNPSLAGFPLLKCWPEDGGRYITLPCVITKDPQTHQRNMGMYRMQVFDERTTGMHWHIHKHGALHYNKSRRLNRPLEVAVAIGPEPAVSLAASAPMPEGVDELLLAGFLKRKPVQLVKCRTVDLEVPAEAEIVLEGVVNPDEKRTEGPFGDHTGHYSAMDEFPVFHIKCITHRKDPIYQTTITGRPPKEDFFMGQALIKIFLPLLQMVLPEVVDINLPAEGVFHNLAVVSIKKQYPWHARKVMHTLWGMGQLMFTKIIIVVDEEVNVHDMSEVWWRVGNNIDPRWDVTITDGVVDMLDPAVRQPHLGTKMGIDATIKTAQEGYEREWPKLVSMSRDIVELVNKRWREYGF